MLLAAAQAAAFAVNDTEPVYRPKKVRSVTIESNQRIIDGSPEGDGENCSKLKITKQDVKNYLEKASSINPHYYSYSRCAAEGQVVFEDGQQGHWAISASRVASLDMADGRRYNIFCRDADCRQKVFVNWRGSNSENEATPNDGRHQARIEAKWRRAKALGQRSPDISQYDLDTSYHRRSIRSLVVNDIMASAPMGADMPDEPCEHFQVTEEDVRRFLQRATAVVHPEDYPQGRCVAQGKVTFSNGQKAIWTLLSSRLGYLNNETSSGGYTLYCPDTVCAEPIYDTFRGINSILDLPGHEPGDSKPR